MLTETKTKLLMHSLKGAPMLENSYGSLKNLLEKVLVEGFNINNIKSFETKDNILKLYLDVGHGYSENTVVTLYNFSEEIYNRDFRVIKSYSDSIDLFLNTDSHPEILLNATEQIKTAPLGYSKTFSDEDAGIACFKNTSTLSPGYLKIIDKVPPNGYLENSNWQKFARVVMGQQMDDLGNFVGDYKSPSHSEFKNIELVGDGVASSNGIHGFAKWDYAIYAAGHHAWENYTGPLGEYPTPWTIIGDSNTFYLMIAARGNKYKEGKNILGFGNYIPENPLESYNLCLQARDGALKATDRDGENFARQRSFFGRLENSLGCFILANVYGGYQPEFRYKCGGMYLGSNQITLPHKTTDVRSLNPISGLWATSKITLKDDDNILRGYHRGVRLLYGIDLPEGLVNNHGDYVLRVQTPLGNSSTYETMPLLFSLRDWEHIE